MNTKREQGGLVHIADVLAQVLPLPELPAPSEEIPAPAPVKVTKLELKRTNRLMAVREDRAGEKPQPLGYLARPFILCGLPFKKPKAGTSHYKRQNGDEILEIVASPEHGLPFGMDIEVLIWTCVLAKQAMLANNDKCPEVLEWPTGADFLKAFDLPLDGASYGRAMRRFLRVFYSTWYFGPPQASRSRAKLWSFRFFKGINLWFDPELNSLSLPGDDFKNNQLFLSDELRKEMERALPVIEMETLKAWSNNPTQIYFNIWLAWRCHDARAKTRIPLLGPTGVKEQCGFEGYNGKRGALDFRGKVTELLQRAKISWPECPVRLVTDDPNRPDYLFIEHAASPIRKRTQRAIS